MPNLHLVFADWTARPGRSANWRESRRAYFPTDELFRREYPETLEDVLLADEDILFPQWAIDQCVEEYEFPAKPILGNPQHRYLKMWDQGRVRDACVGVVLDLTRGPYQVCDYRRLVKQPYGIIQSTIEEIDKTYPGPTYVGDDNTALAIVENLKVPATHFLMGAQKPRCIQSLKVALESRYLQIHPSLTQLLWELQGYMWDDKDLVQDSVLALANAMFVAGPPLNHIETPVVAEVPSRAAGLRQQGQQREPSRIGPLVVGASTSSRRARHFEQSGRMAEEWVR